MTPRMNIFQAAPEGAKAMIAVETAINQSGLEHGLSELVRLRASQINGCAFCIHMHATDARKHGESDMRIHLLDAWRDSPAFTDRERAALNWTESLTRIGKTHAPDADYALLQSQFNETEIANLTLLIGAINLWNRVQIGLRAVHPVEAPAAAAA
ncbi:AhpD family alkylhydroperoxidase [Sphingomonas naasensis]|uniref:Carboxymuconolactone decarboxylase family protein n=1 Tax=Sphingomonas naasensis TaxID=1344951 RepID=A0A4S1WIB5_9SPHN|nr:carboxymuconolactone decarboxylase family protein [Sphingomonas naasensis]NIJ21645.1 AhpD family alkylhydroperoxidase [Sphingomonas naasensis]TGX41420.1 carboxymuconolactone decarboxylase family protein [Sphingomonas naasensis]